MPLRNEPDLPLGVGEHEIAFAGFAWVVHAEDFVDVVRVKMALIDGVRMGRVGAVEGVNLHVQSGIDVHGRVDANCAPRR